MLKEIIAPLNVCVGGESIKYLEKSLSPRINMEQTHEFSFSYEMSRPETASRTGFEEVLAGVAGTCPTEM